MRARLTNIDSIKKVLADMTLEEKLNMVGAYKACHTLEIPDMNIPAIRLMDGATGINGVQLVLDYLTAPDMESKQSELQKLNRAYRDLMKLNEINLDKAREEYKGDKAFLGLIDHISKVRPRGKNYISFPSGINIGASFNEETADRIGEAIGWEMRDSNVDICLGPNVDIARDPLGGRNYEMYGEDPHLVSQIAASFIRGMQRTGVGACAKHFIANNQETNRNTTDTHVSERTLREIYSKGFMSAVRKAKVKAVMSAYNSVNGKFSSYNKTLLTDWLRDEWGFEGVIVSDWGAVSTKKEESLAAGMNIILCGPNDMSECQKAVEEGKLTLEVLDERVSRILKLIVELREEQENTPAQYDQEELLKTAYDTIVDGSVLLKNKNNVLPLNEEAKVTFYGKRSKDMVEYGTGSTAVITNLHSNVYDECKERYQKNGILFETMEDADTLIYTVAAPAGENADRDVMDIEETDRILLPKVLKEAKEKGLKTVVLLNISGPVDMRKWIDYADAVLCIFIPGCMGGKAAADILFGKAFPAGKLPVTFPVRYEDTPSYPNFPGEHSDVYYGEGIFIGYRSYEKRDISVQFPFGYGLSYTDFTVSVEQNIFDFDLENQEFIEIPIRVKNVGNRKGSEVIQLYVGEKKPRILRPVKELMSFCKVYLKPGEEKTIALKLEKESLRCFDSKMQKWVIPVGDYNLFIGTSAADICAMATMKVAGINEYALGPESTIGDIIKSPEAISLINQYTGGFFDMVSDEDIKFMINQKLSDILSVAMIQMIPDTVKLNEILHELYEKLGNIDL